MRELLGKRCVRICARFESKYRFGGESGEEFGCLMGERRTEEL